MRNQIVAVVGALVWMLAVEQVLITASPLVARWMPVAASWGLLQLGPIVTTKSALLAAPIGGLVFAGYVLLAGVLAFRVTP